MLANAYCDLLLHDDFYQKRCPIKADRKNMEMFCARYFDISFSKAINSLPTDIFVRVNINSSSWPWTLYLPV